MADLDDFVELHDDPEVTRYIRRPTRPEAEERLRDVEREWAERRHGVFAVLNKASGRFLGRAGLKYWRQFDETEIGWVLRRDAWGHGYATEAAGACLAWGFSTLPDPYITAMIDPNNLPSIRVALRLSFAPLRNDTLLDSEVVVYALKRDDWSAASRGAAHRPALSPLISQARGDSGSRSIHREPPYLLRDLSGQTGRVRPDVVRRTRPVIVSISGGYTHAAGVSRTSAVSSGRCTTIMLRWPLGCVAR